MNNKTYLGIELGSTRIKSVLIDENHKTVATGAHDWENKLKDGYWTYSLDDVWVGIQDSFKKLCDNCDGDKSAVDNISGIGVSAMMHGYLAFNQSGELLVPFRTWRNTTTESAAKLLTERFAFNIPQRWSIAHLYQAILNNESHVKDIDFITTLAGYVHWKLTGQKVLGVGDASGVFPIDSQTNEFNKKMINEFKPLVSRYKWNLEDILPSVLNAGENAGFLTDEGAKLLAPSGILKSGIPMCPPEGDAGTGMVATNSVAERTGNISAGTSVFAMIVLEKVLSKLYTEIDMVTTPSGKPVAMVHCNNCTSDLDAWVKLFGEALEVMGVKTEKSKLYDTLYFKALEADIDCGGLLSYNYYSGEPITNLTEGRPLFTRLPDSSMNLANFMRVQLYSAMATLKIGMDILTEKEKVSLDRLLGHGGLFKTKNVGQRLMAAALNTPVAVMESAGEGGPWGMAVLAAYMCQKEVNQTLDVFLNERVFGGLKSICTEPDEKDFKSFEMFIERYKKGLDIERAAIEKLK